MGLLSKLVAKVMARSEARQQPTVESPLITRIHGEPPPVTTTDPGLGFTGSITVPASPSVSESEVAERVREYAFVLNSDPPQLKTGEQWWSEKTHKRRRSEGSDRAYD